MSHEIRMFGQDVPSVVPGPSGLTSILGVVFLGDEPAIDNGALHARSHLETGIAFGEDPALAGRGERFVNVWVAALGRSALERFLGATSVEVWIDREAGRGWKKLADHVNRMSAAVRGKVDLQHLSAVQRKNLAKLLSQLAPAAWEKTGEDTRRALA
ncbi:YwhD family protein [bacterium]|nr:YwhD family protein [bacterium]